MTTDIVTRLYGRLALKNRGDDPEILKEAAEEIERLRTENKDLDGHVCCMTSTCWMLGCQDREPDR